MTAALPSKVQRLSDNEFVDPRALKAGDQFVHASYVWTVKEVRTDGIDCAVDQTKFLFGG